MKHTSQTIACAIAGGTMLLAACTQGPATQAAAPRTISAAQSPADVIRAYAAASSALEPQERSGSGGADAAPGTAPRGTDAAFGAVDVDLTRLSSTMVYSEVFNMLVEPERYEGKTVRMKGAFYPFDGGDSPDGAPSFACIIQDAAACCAQGLEFTLAGEHAFPQDYPAPYSEITVAGNYYYYEKDGISYLGLNDAVLE